MESKMACYHAITEDNFLTFSYLIISVVGKSFLQ